MTTDKEKISAKIEQLKEELKDLPSGDYKDGVIYVLEEELIPFINSLFTEHQGKEFKEEFEHYCVHGDIRNPNFEGPFGYDDIRKTAIHFANWQKQTLINKAYNWICNNFKCAGYSMPLYYKGVHYSPQDIANDFKKAMKEE